MTTGPRLRVVEEPQAVEAALPAPHRFTRLVSTPPAAPWRQRQIADLEARLGSPLSSHAVAYRLTRTEPWKLGAVGRFSVVYARDGGSIPALVGNGATPADGLERIAGAFEDLTTRRLLALAITLASLLVCGLAISSALSSRAEVRNDLQSLDRSMGVGERRTRQLTTLQRQTLALDSLGGKERSVGQVLSDLDWVAAHRRPEIAIASFHWISGISAVEAATPDSPFSNTDRPVQRASHPIRPGVWLWGVVPPGHSR